MKKVLSAILSLVVVSACALSFASCQNEGEDKETDTDTAATTTTSSTTPETKPETKPETQPETEPETEPEGPKDIFAEKCYITEYVDYASVKLAPEGSEEAGEGAENLFDNDTSTKLCSKYDTAVGTDVIFKLVSENEIGGAIVDGINFATGNDSAVESGRNPTSYKLYGSNDDGATWELISESDALVLPEGNEEMLDADIEITSTTAYSSFKISFPTIIGDAHIQLSEIYIHGQLVKTA